MINKPNLENSCRKDTKKKRKLVHQIVKIWFHPIKNLDFNIYLLLFCLPVSIFRRRTAIRCHKYSAKSGERIEARTLGYFQQRSR